MAHPRQMSFFDGDEHPTSANISIKKNHELVELTHIIDWPEFIELATDIRASKVKFNAGKEPHYRELLGAIALMSIRSAHFWATIYQRPSECCNFKRSKLDFK